MKSMGCICKMFKYFLIKKLYEIKSMVIVKWIKKSNDSKMLESFNQ